MNPILGKRYNRYLKRASMVLRAWQYLGLPGHSALANRFWRRFVRRLDRDEEPLRWVVATENEGKPGSGLESITEEDAWIRLKVRTYVAARCEQHDRYQACLQEYDPALRLFRQGVDGHARFFGSGHGGSALDAYRRIRLRETGQPLIFEKIYSTLFDDVFRIEWLEQQFGDFLRARGVWLPQIMDVRHGARTVAVYSDFVSARRLPKKKAVSRAVEIVQVLMDAPQTSATPEYQDYQNRSIYLQSLASARTLVTRFRPEAVPLLEKIATEVSGVPLRYLTHGDLHYKNMLANGAVLDWDNCGFYPFGYDLALAFSKSLAIAEGRILVDDIERNFDLAALGDRDSLLLCALFFCFLFYSRKSGLKLEDKVVIDIFDQLVAVHKRVANDHS